MDGQGLTEELKHEFEVWIRTIIAPLCDHPEDIQVRMLAGSPYSGTIYLETNPDDVKFVVGAAAHVISSLRSFASARAGRHHVRVNVEYTTDLDQRDQRGGHRDREFQREAPRAYRQVGGPRKFDDL